MGVSTSAAHLKLFVPPSQNMRNSRNNWQMLVPNCRLLFSENLHLYVHALVCLSGCASLSACDVDVVIQKTSPKKNNKHPPVFLQGPSDLVLL